MICTGAVWSYIESGTPGASTTDNSCYVFPGLNLSHYYAYVHGYVLLCTFEEAEGQPLGVYAGFDGDFNLSGNSLHGTEFTSFWKFAKDYFEWETGDEPPDGYQKLFTFYHGGSGSFDWDWDEAEGGTAATKPTVGADVNPADYGLFRIGDINMFNWDEETGDGYLYMLGGAYYTVTDPGTAESVKILFEGTAPLHDYFPWAIKVSGGWRSCNSQDHGHQSRHNSAWRDDKNRDGDSSGSTVFYYQSGSWKVAPRIE